MGGVRVLLTALRAGSDQQTCPGNKKPQNMWIYLSRVWCVCVCVRQRTRQIQKHSNEYRDEDAAVPEQGRERDQRLDARCVTVLTLLLYGSASCGTGKRS